MKRATFAIKLLITMLFLGPSLTIASELPFKITCRADLYKVDRLNNLVKETSEITAPFLVSTPALKNRGDSQFTAKFQGGYELNFYAQAGVAQSPWEDGANSAYVNVSLLKIKVNGDKTVLALQKGSTDNLDAKWKVGSHASGSLVETFIEMNNPEIQTATLKASAELGQELSGKYTVLIEKGYIPDGTVNSALIRCTIPKSSISALIPGSPR